MVAAAIMSFLMVVSVLVSPTPIEKAKSSIIMLNIEDLHGKSLSSGTGFVVSKDGKPHIVTNSHVCNTAKVMYSYTEEGERVAHKVIKHSQKSDLCMLSSPNSMKPLNIARDIEQDQDIHIVGFPYGAYQITQSGRYKGPWLAETPWNLPNPLCKDKDYLRLEMQTRRLPNGKLQYRQICVAKFTDMSFTTVLSAPGASGSPALDDMGRVVGVVSMIQTRGIPWAITVSLESLKAFLEE